MFELDFDQGLPTQRDADPNAPGNQSYPLVPVAGGGYQSLAADPLGRFVFVLGGDYIGVYRFTRDPNREPLVKVDADRSTPSIADDYLLHNGIASSIVPDPTGRFLYAPSTGGTVVFRVESQTGEIESLGLATTDTFSQLAVLGNR